MMSLTKYYLVLQRYSRRHRLLRSKRVLLVGKLKLAKMRRIVSKMRQPSVAQLCTSIWNIIFREEKLLDLTREGRAARSMARAIIDQGLSGLEEIWGSEVTLFYPGLYAGQTDLCGIYSGRESIIDFKQTNKPKRREWVEDYFLQLAAYAMAHDVIYGTCIDQGVILMCSKDGFFQKFTSNGGEFTRFKHKFLGKIDQFYQKKK